MRKLTDKFGRVHDYLRFSITDRNNLSYTYFDNGNNPRKLLHSKDMLSKDELYRVVKMFVKEFGFKKVRFTGGEPLLRKDLPELLEELNALKTESDFIIAVTTNAVLLFDKLSKLKKSGVTEININLDTLDRKKFLNITGKDKFPEVMNSIGVALNQGFDRIKINCVIVKGVNDDEIQHFAAFAYLNNINVRFIEYNSYGSPAANDKRLVPVSRIKDIIGREHNISLIEESRNEVAEDYRILGSSGTLSFISGLTGHFCESCRKIRITPRGHLKLCKFSKKLSEFDLKPLLRDSKYTDAVICRFIEGIARIKKAQHPPVEELIQLKNRNLITKSY
jgi:cyclic pyranopterin phosphate synthase